MEVEAALLVMYGVHVIPYSIREVNILVLIMWSHTTPLLPDIILTCAVLIRIFANLFLFFKVALSMALLSVSVTLQNSQNKV